MISDEALEAAVQAIVASLPNDADLETHRIWATGYANAALEAAAPIVVARAIECALTDFERESVFLTPAQETMARYLRARTNPHRSQE